MTPEDRNILKDILKILWNNGKIAPLEQFLLVSTIFYYLFLNFHIITFQFEMWVFEISEVEVRRVDYLTRYYPCVNAAESLANFIKSHILITTKSPQNEQANNIERSDASDSVSSLFALNINISANKNNKSNLNQITGRGRGIGSSVLSLAFPGYFNIYCSL